MAEEKKKKGDGKEIFPLYAEALEIYKGEFLSEELYAPWPERKREELRSKYLELLNKMANFHERQGSLKKAMDCYKKAIQVDPLIEESYQKLMTLYSNKGMYNEALRIYEDCRKALKRELKAQPNSTTSAIHKKILEKVGFPPRSTTRKGLSKQKAR
jgi:two-component SAPR family response regulator